MFRSKPVLVPPLEGVFKSGPMGGKSLCCERESRGDFNGEQHERRKVRVTHRVSSDRVLHFDVLPDELSDALKRTDGSGGPHRGRSSARDLGPARVLPDDRDFTNLLVICSNKGLKIRQSRRFSSL